MRAITWYKVDDKLHSHKKAIKADDAMALWVMAGSWCADQLTDGFIPDYVVCRMFPARGEEWAARLVSVGLWHDDHLDGDDGWRFHQWDAHQPTKSDVERKREEARDRMARVRGKKSAGSSDVRANSERTSHDVPLTPSRPDPSLKNNTSDADAPTVRSGYTEEFEAWWKTYPSTINKAGAFKAYKAAAKKHDDLAAKLRGYLNARNRQQKSGEFVPALPHATTWLNQERWNDYGEQTTITLASGSVVPEWSKDECDAILGGSDHWVPDSPPADLEIPDQMKWTREQYKNHLNERRRQAWEVTQRG